MLPETQKVPRLLSYFFGVLIVALLIGSPIAYARYRQVEFRNFRVVDEEVLYR